MLEFFFLVSFRISGSYYNILVTDVIQIHGITKVNGSRNVSM